MTLLLRYVSGVTLTERGAIGRTPEYAEYVRRTPAFFPRIRGAEAGKPLLVRHHPPSPLHSS
jgi:steroid 5-alpha reductase family enzyme